MHVEYQLTPDDLFAYHWRAYFHSPVRPRPRWRPLLLLFFAFLLFSARPTLQDGAVVFRPINWPLLAAGFPAAALAYWWLERWLVGRAIRRLVAREKPDCGQLGRHHVTLGESGLSHSNAVGESRTYWAGVDRVEEDQDYIYVFTAAASAYLIPKRAFASGEAEAFYQMVQREAERAAPPRPGGGSP